jgi:hypothetical protein
MKKPYARRHQRPCGNQGHARVRAESGRRRSFLQQKPAPPIPDRPPGYHVKISFDYGQHNRAPYLAMELLRESLHQRLQREQR